MKLVTGIGSALMLLVSSMPLAYAESAIIGGKLVDPESDIAKSTVAIIEDGISYCTGTVIGKQLILTAGHCISNTTNPELFVTSGPIAEKGVLYKVSHFKYFFQNTLDVALLVTEKELPLVPVSIGIPAHLKIGTRVIQAGYGLRVDDEVLGRSSDPSYFKKFIGELHFIDGNVVTNINLSDLYNPDYVHRELRVSERSDYQVYSGDSGGPLYLEIDGKLQVLGVTQGSSNSETGYTQPYYLINWMNCALPEKLKYNHDETNLQDQFPCDGEPLRNMQQLFEYNDKRCSDLRPGFRLIKDLGCAPATRETCQSFGDRVFWNEGLQKCEVVQ